MLDMIRLHLYRLFHVIHGLLPPPLLSHPPFPPPCPRIQLPCLDLAHHKLETISNLGTLWYHLISIPNCRSMGVLLRSLKFCLTSEGQQAVLAAVICLLVLQAFLDRAPALQVCAALPTQYSPGYKSLLHAAAVVPCMLSLLLLLLYIQFSMALLIAAVVWL